MPVAPGVYLSPLLAHQPTLVAPDLEETTTLGFSLTVDDGELFSTAQVELIITVSDGGPSGDYSVNIQALLTYRGTVLETARTLLGASSAGSSVRAVRVRLPSGEYVDIPPVEGGFITFLPGMPEVDAVYTFEGLGEEGDVMEGFICEAVYSGSRVDPPRGVEASIENGFLAATWAPVTPTEGFNPGVGLGAYEMSLFGGLNRFQRTGDTRGIMSLEALPPGLYDLVITAFAVAPESSCHPARLVENSHSSDVLEEVFIEISEDGSASIVSP